MGVADDYSKVVGDMVADNNAGADVAADAKGAVGVDRDGELAAATAAMAVASAKAAAALFSARVFW